MVPLRMGPRQWLKLASLFFLLFCICSKNFKDQHPAATESARSGMQFRRRLLQQHQQQHPEQDDHYQHHHLQSPRNRNNQSAPHHAHLFQLARSHEHKEEEPPCAGAARHADRCTYALSHQDCQSGGLIEYIQIFYCINPRDSHQWLQWLCYIGIAIWLAALFYMLGSTAADYFCSCLERLSQILRLPPTVAGVTLLPLGNGAPDVFASVVSFVGSSGRHGGGAVGMSSVLGGAAFVITVVTGVVNIMVAREDIHLDGSCFMRDGIFFLFTLGYLFLVLWRGEITVWVALGYLGIYVVYAAVVVLWEVVRSRKAAGDQQRGEYAQLSDSKQQYEQQQQQRQQNLDRAITVPAWFWASHAIYSGGEKIIEEVEAAQDLEQEEQKPDEENLKNEGGNEEGNGDNKEKKMTKTKSLLKLGRKASQVLIHMPLALPRQLTIPVVEESRWSRRRAVVAATLAPVLLVAVWSAENNTPWSGDWGVLAIGAVAGTALGVTAYATTVDDRPPQGRGAAPLLWIAAGFFMSMVWFYVIARELVAALVSLAALLGIDASILGLTLLAWGNSMGDLVANTALACRGGNAGVQIAISGCYAGPMFNTLVGLGVSLLIASARAAPAVYFIPSAPMGMVTVVFLAAAVAVSMVSLFLRGMRPSRALGVVLLGIYGMFLVVRGCDTLGMSLG